MTKPRILDLFCGGGGAAMGYHQVGFDVVGVDLNPQPNYPFDFIREDLSVQSNYGLSFLRRHGIDPDGFDAIHASPPCQAYTRKGATWGRERKYWFDHPELIELTRGMLVGSGKPYVLENVIGAPLEGCPVVLCGTMFDLRIIKHRQFETNWNLVAPEARCDHSDVYNPWQGKGRSADKLRAAQDIDWLPISGGASRKAGYTGDLFNAIPPAYTRFIGEQLLTLLQHESLAA